MGRTARPTHAHRGTQGPARLAKKALSTRPRHAKGTGAKPRPGRLDQGRSGARSPGQGGAIAWLPTLLRGRPRRAEDLVRTPRSRAAEQLWLVIVDASASTRRHGALSRAKGLLAQLFDDAYKARARLAVLAASGRQAQWHWQGRKADARLQPWLQGLGAGGGTPLPDALAQAARWLSTRQRQRPGEEQRVLILTDGRLKDLPALQPLGCTTLLVDIESGPIRLGRARQLATLLEAEYQALAD